MKITSVHYSRVHSLPGYENEKIGLTADVDEDEDADKVIDALRAQVNKQIGLREEVETLEGRAIRAKQYLNQVEGVANRLKEQVTAYREGEPEIDPSDPFSGH